MIWICSFDNGLFDRVTDARIKKSGSTLITIGFVIRPKIDLIWPLGTMTGTMAATASKDSRDFSKFSDYHTSGKFLILLVPDVFGEDSVM